MTPARHSQVLTPAERLLLALAVVFAVISVGTAGFVLIEKWPFFQALYMTLVIISTLGMRSEYVEHISRAGEVWVMLLIVLGLAAVAAAFTTLGSMVIEGQLRSILGRRKVSLKIASLTDHFIVCGYGAMGRNVCACLRARRAPLVVIDRDPQNTAPAEQDGFLYVLGDASQETTLRSAGVERAKGLVSLLPADADNVFVTLVARDLNPKLFIAARVEQADNEPRLLRAGANTTICPEVIGAQRVANILTRPGVVDFLDFAAEGLDLEAEQVVLAPAGKLIGQSLRQANLPRRIGLLVVALKRQDGQTLFNPDADTVLASGDTLIVIGRAGALAALEKVYA